MRTIATLNLPASISGICVPEAAPAVQAVADAAAPDAAGLDAAGAAEPPHAATTREPAINKVRIRVRPTIDTTPPSRDAASPCAYAARARPLGAGRRGRRQS